MLHAAPHAGIGGASTSAALLTQAAPLPDISESLLADFSAFVEGDRNFLGAAALG